MSAKTLTRIFAVIALFALILIFTSPIVWIYFGFVTFIKYLIGLIFIEITFYSLMKIVSNLIKKQIK